MSLTKSTILPLGTKMPHFFLQDTVSGNYMSLEDLKSAKATVIMFICNHCPYVIHINQEIVAIANDYKNKGVSFIAISSNDIEAYPDDAPDKMRLVAKVLKYPFPYLYDKRQEVAKNYNAACTPDFYVLNKNLELTYRGRLDNSSPGNGIPVSGTDLRAAIDATLEGKLLDNQYPSMGCSIKWKTS